ncbi:MAG: hypothetical protein FWB93_04135 [Oscillospiraceae bacterium]|nr:hypothetical protein [Oscillospiraceae bacterium]
MTNFTYFDNPHHTTQVATELLRSGKRVETKISLSPNIGGFCCFFSESMV